MMESFCLQGKENLNFDCLKCGQNQLIKCKEIIEKYNIDYENDELTFPQANDFIKDVFHAGWAHPYSFRDLAIIKGYAVARIKGDHKKIWLISVKNIIIMMNEKIPFYMTTPLFKYGNKKEYPMKNNFIDWSKNE